MMDINKRNMVYIADDDDKISSFYKRTLEHDYDTMLFDNGNDVIKTYKQNIEDDERPDLIITDLDMPIASGLEVIDMIRNTYKEKNIPIIFNTGREIDEFLKLFEEDKRVLVLQKPVGPIKLRESVASMLIK